MGGIAIHSCGNWTHTMPLIKDLTPSCTSIECAVDLVCDPNPNDPEKLRDALAGSGIYAHVRMTGKTEPMLEIVKKLLHPELKLVVHPMFVDAALEALLSGFYGGK